MEFPQESLKLPTMFAKAPECLTFAQHLPSCLCSSGTEISSQRKKSNRKQLGFSGVHQLPLRSVRNLQRRKIWGYFLTFSFGSRFMVFRGRSTRRTRRDLMVLMSLPLVPLQGRKRHKNNRGNRLLLSQVTPRGVCGYPGWLWWWNWLGLGLFFMAGFVSILSRAAGRMSQPHLGWVQQHEEKAGAGQGPGRAQPLDVQALSPPSHSPGAGALPAPTPHRTRLPGRAAAPGQEAQLLHPAPGRRRDKATRGSSLPAG